MFFFSAGIATLLFNSQKNNKLTPKINFDFPLITTNPVAVFHTQPAPMTSSAVPESFAHEAGRLAGSHLAPSAQELEHIHTVHTH